MVTHDFTTVFAGSFTQKPVAGTIPAGSGATKASAIDTLHHHTAFLDCGPFLVSYSLAPEPVWDAYEVPKGLKPLANRVESYNVKNKYENPIMGADISSTYEFIDLADGIWVRTRSPMGTVLDSTYTVREGAEGGLEILYQAECRCNKALIGMAKKELEKSCGLLIENVAKRLGEA